MQKANQDSHMVIKDYNQISNLWLLGVMDGHGINGHNVSQFVQAQLPAIMGGLLAGLPPEKAIKQEPLQSPNNKDSLLPKISSKAQPDPS